MTFVVVLSLLLADAPKSVSFAVEGFSADGSRFGITVTEPGEKSGALQIYRTDTGARETEPPPPGTFGKDKGAEHYASGTATSTSFTLAAGPLKLETSPGPPAKLLLSRGPCRLEAPLPAGGTSFNLVSVLSSADEKSLAIILKRLVDGVRRPAVVALRVDPSALSKDECTKPSTPANACITRLRELKGHWRGEEQEQDFEGGQRVPRFGFDVSDEGGQLSLGIDYNVGVGSIFSGRVTACRMKGDTLIVTVQGGKETSADGEVVVRRDGADLSVSAEVYDWQGSSAAARTRVTEKFSR